MMDAYTIDRPRLPRYVPLLKGGQPVFVHFPVLTPDNGIIMCTTQADQERVAYDLNRLTERLRAIAQRVNSPAIQGLRALCVKIAAEDERYPEADMNLDLAQELCDHTPEIIALLDEMQRAGSFVPQPSTPNSIFGETRPAITVQKWPKI